VNQFSRFTKKQTDYIQNSFDSWLNVLEGGKRGSKDVVNNLAWCACIDNHEDKLHLAGGVSVATTKLNIIDCNGFGVLNYFKGRCKQGKYQERDAVYVDTPKGQKIILISGGGKDGDEKLIKGNTYGTVNITEINECHEKFVKEAFDRTTSSTDRKIFGCFNPKKPTHKFYEDILNFHEKKQAKNPDYGYNYAHMTIADNLSISDEQLLKILNTYDKSSIWYKRDIEGLRVQAEGLIFEQFADNPEHWHIKDTPDYLALYIGVDFGGNKAKTVYTLTGLTVVNDKPRVDIIKSHALPAGGGISSEQITDEFFKFFEASVKKYNKIPHHVNVDHLEAQRVSFIKKLQSEGYDVPIYMVNKASISLAEWCRYLNSLFNLNMIAFSPENKLAIDCFKNLVYDEKAEDDQPVDDDVTCDVDTYDSCRYSMVEALIKLIKKGLLL